MKSYKLFYLTILLLLSSLKPVFAQIALTVHPRELVTFEKSYAYKNARNKLYNETLEKIKDAKQDVLELRTRITLIQNYIYKSMTTVNGAIKQAKALEFSINRIAHIIKDLDELRGIAWSTFSAEHITTVYMEGPNGTSPTPIEMIVRDYVILKESLAYIDLIGKRITKLEKYIADFILKQTNDGFSIGGEGNGLIQIGGKAPMIISNVIREKFLSNVYSQIYYIDIDLHSFIYKAKAIHIQTEVRKINPFSLYINKDKMMLNTIINDLKL